MGLTNNSNLRELRKVSVNDDLNDYKNLKNIISKLDDKKKMANNIDEAKEKFNELNNLYNIDFSESSLHNIFKTHLEEMQAILIKHSISFQDVINMYQASYECNDIYNSFRGDKIE